MNSIVFVGNCQIQAIYHLFQQFAWEPSEQTLTYVPSYEAIDPAAAVEIAKADLIVEQVFDMPPKAHIDGLNTNARRVLVPLVGCNFLWPFAGAPRLHNPVRSFLPMGVFPAEAGISFLDRMIRDGADPETAVEAFMNFDVPKRINLDRLYELSQDRQRRRDEMTDFAFAALTERHFRDERLFLSVYHPDTRIAIELAALTFERLGVARRDIDRLRRAIRRTPFPPGELPIHPAVAEYFGLRYLPQEPRFAFLNEGRLTFREIALRYMRCEWNEPLAEGIDRVKNGDLTGGEALLIKGLARSPGAALGHVMLGRAQHQMGRPADAISSLNAAIALHPDDPHAWRDLAAALQSTGDWAAAEAAFRRAIDLDPWDAHGITLLAHLLHAAGRVADAVDAIAAGLATDGDSAALHLEMAFLREAQGDWHGAVQSYRLALRLDPTLPAHGKLAAAQLRAERATIATLAAQARNLRDAGAHAQACEILRQIEGMAAEDADSRMLLAEALMQTGQSSQAASLLAAVCEQFPDRPRSWLMLGELRMQIGDLAGAEVALRSALSSGENGHICFLLMVALERQGRYADAIRIGQRMVALEPDSPHRHLQLALMGMRAGNPAGTEQSLQRAFELAPDEPRFLSDLAEALMHAGSEAQAVQVARRAQRLAPDDAGLRDNLVRKLLVAGALEEARAIVGIDKLAPPALSSASSPECHAMGILNNACATIVFDGDSIAAGIGAGEDAGLDSAFMRATGARGRVYNIAAPGRPVSDCLLRFDSAVAPLYDERSDLNLIVFHAGDNDLNMGCSAAQTYRLFSCYVALAQAQGWKVVVSTELPRPDFVSSKAVELATYNCLLLRNDAAADIVVDFNKDPRFGDVAERNGSAWFADDLHPNEAGYAVLGRCLADVSLQLFDRPVAVAPRIPA